VESETRNGEPEILPADKTHRNWIVAVALLGAILVLLLVVVLDEQIEEIKRQAGEDPRKAVETILRLIAVTACVSGAGLVGMALWFWRLGRRVRLTGRFPPPGMKVIRDTPVRTGPRARNVANVARLTALLCALAGTVGMWYLHQLAVAALRLAAR